MFRLDILYYLASIFTSQKRAKILQGKNKFEIQKLQKTKLKNQAEQPDRSFEMKELKRRRMFAHSKKGDLVHKH